MDVSQIVDCLYRIAASLNMVARNWLKSYEYESNHLQYCQEQYSAVANFLQKRMTSTITHTKQRLRDLAPFLKMGAQGRLRQGRPAAKSARMSPMKMRAYAREDFFGDIRPYFCTLEHCDSQRLTFGTLTERFLHENEPHNGTWICRAYCGKAFRS